MENYTIRSVPVTDIVVALQCEADRAEKENFHGVAERQRELALHIENAYYHMTGFLFKGQRVDMDITFVVRANVNPVVKPEYRKVPSHGEYVR